MIENLFGKIKRNAKNDNFQDKICLFEFKIKQHLRLYRKIIYSQNLLTFNKISI
jgi:hypothetical protein